MYNRAWVTAPQDSTAPPAAATVTATATATATEIPEIAVPPSSRFTLSRKPRENTRKSRQSSLIDDFDLHKVLAEVGFL
jgi:TPP-dependent trihydroxycyclohexane-1,2-dione (THcHDO) dehydratase